MPISVPTKRIKPGMTLAEPVVNRWGQVLLDTGCQLTQDHISVLETWEISTVIIENGKEADALSPPDPATLERLKKRVKERFLWEPNSLLEKKIYSLAFGQALRRFQVQQRPGSGLNRGWIYACPSDLKPSVDRRTA